MSATTLQFDPMDLEFLQDPYPTFRRLRNEAPLHFTDFAGGFWLATRYSDLSTIMRDTSLQNRHEGSQHFARLDGGPAERFSPAILNQLDGERHTRIRKVGEKALSRRALVESIGPQLDTLADEAVDRALEAEEIDAFTEFAHDVPLRAFCRLLDLPDQDRHMLYGWITDFFGIFVPEALDADGIARTHQAVRNFIDYLSPVVAARRASPGNDVLSMFVTAESDGQRLTDDEVMTLVTQTIAGGFDTSSAMIAAAVHCLAAAPEQMDLLREDPQRSASAAVAEVLRWESPVQMTPRYTTTEIEIAGVVLPVGARIGCVVASANRDEAAFQEPDRFVIDRAGTPGLHFGGGPHFCIGNQLARLEGEAILQSLGRKCARIEPTGHSERVITTMVRRGFAKVPVRFHPA